MTWETQGDIILKDNFKGYIFFLIFHMYFTPGKLVIYFPVSQGAWEPWYNSECNVCCQSSWVADKHCDNGIHVDVTCDMAENTEMVIRVVNPGAQRCPLGHG